MGPMTVTPKTNWPQEMLSFLQAITVAVKQPESLAPLVEAAAKVDTAHKFTAEQEEAYSAALAVIEEATHTRQLLDRKTQELATGQRELAEQTKKLIAAEKACDERNTALAAAEKTLADGVKDVADQARAVKDEAKRVKAGQDALASDTKKFEARVAAFEKREKARQQAEALVAANG